jgi:Peptidase A4 family
MGRRKLSPRKAVAALAATGLLTTAGLGASPAAAAITQTTSSNWAGYVVSGKDFSSVSGSWVVPTAGSDAEGYSAFWVGLGGSNDNSQGLEQIGTDSDYANGNASYYAWYELLPDASVKLDLPIHAGDQVSATVTANGTEVTISLSDQTTGKSVTKSLQDNDVDTSSAEWIAEAPSGSSGFGGSGDVLPLADFGTVTFTDAAATAGGHTGSISDSQWDAERVQLAASPTGMQVNSAPSAFGTVPRPATVSASSAEATTSPLSSDGSSFSVTWHSSGSSQAATAVPFGGGGYGGRPYGGGPYGGGGPYARGWGGYGWRGYGWGR